MALKLIIKVGDLVFNNFSTHAGEIWIVLAKQKDRVTVKRLYTTKNIPDNKNLTQTLCPFFIKKITPKTLKERVK